MIVREINNVDRVIGTNIKTGKTEARDFIGPPQFLPEVSGGPELILRPGQYNFERDERMKSTVGCGIVHF